MHFSIKRGFERAQDDLNQTGSLRDKQLSKKDATKNFSSFKIQRARQEKIIIVKDARHEALRI